MATQSPFVYFLRRSNFYFIQTLYHHLFDLGVECFCNCTLSTRLLEKQLDYQPRLLELYRGVRGHAPREKVWKIGLSETPYPAFHGSNATNLYVYFVELFSQSLVIHDSRAEVQRFMIPKFLKQRFIILTCFVSRNRN